MKTIIKCSIALLMFGLTSIAYGQTTPPDKVVLDEKDYYKHGSNSSGITVYENRDSVTVTSVIKYFVLPDPAISPDYKYDPTNIKDFTNVKSKFDWSLENSLGIVDNSEEEPIVTVTWNAIGASSVKVKEIPNVGTACAGTETSIPVDIIKKPEIAFAPKGTIYRDSACYTQTQITGGIQLSFDMMVTTGISTAKSAQVEIDYTVKKDEINQSSLAGTAVRVVDNKIELIVSDYGRYEITITKVTDRISRKSTNAEGNPIEGEITDAGDKFTYNVMKPAQTGPIYRIPNNF